MSVYVEYVLLDNFAMDLFLLWAAAVTLKLPHKKWRVALGALVGALFATASVFVGGWWGYLLKALCLFCMCVVAVGFGKKLFWYILLTLAYTFVMGGAITGLFYLFKVSYVAENGTFYQTKVPLFVYFAALGLVSFLCCSLCVFVRQTKRVAPFLVQATAHLGKDSKVTAFCDSGNSVAHNGLPVCFVTRSFGGFAQFVAQQTLRGKVEKICIQTLSGQSVVQAVQCSVTANGITLPVYLALPAAKCYTTYHIILANAFMEEGK